MFSFLRAIPLLIASWLSLKCIKFYFTKGPLDNIPGPPSSSILFGNLREFSNRDSWEFIKQTCARYGNVIKGKALLGNIVLYVFDPKAMHHILVKDQHAYEPSTFGVKEVLGEGLLATKGEQHRKQRKMLNPVFSTAHMRGMVPIFWEVSYKLRDSLISQVQKGETEIDISHWMTRMALELVGQSGLGYSFDSMAEDASPHPYSTAVKELIPTLGQIGVLQFILKFLLTTGTPTFRRWLIDVSPFSVFRRLRDITDLMYNTSIEILESKRNALAKGDESASEKVSPGKDIISILLKANMQAAEEDRLPENEVLGQMSTLTFAAMDTTSNALSRILHLLCLHPEVQEKLRLEITESVAKHGDLSYDEIESLSYLDAVCRETLRLHPPVSHVTRFTNQDIILPLSNPLKGEDGKYMEEILLPKGTDVIVSILSANRNPEVWGEDSLEWKPERWLNPLPQSVIEAHIPGVYSHLMTFIGGGRACIGFKFSQLEMKVVLVMLLNTFKLKLSDKPIFWAMHGITIPTVVGGDPAVPSLPIMLSLVEG